MAGDKDLVGTPQQVEEQLDALLAGLGEDAGGKAGEGPAENLDPVSGLEEIFLTHHSRLVAGGSAELLDQLRWDDGRIAAKANQAEGAAGGADGGTVLGQHIEADEEVAREEGLDDLVPAPAPPSGRLDPGKEGLETLTLEVFLGQCLVAGLGVNGVPMFHGGFTYFLNGLMRQWVAVSDRGAPLPGLWDVWLFCFPEKGS